MGKIKFIFLSEKFYEEYSNDNYPEIALKPNRPYIQICLEIDGVLFAIPLRSNIEHPFAVWTNKKKHCGADLSKTVVLKDDTYIDTTNQPYIRQDEFDALRGKDYTLKKKLKGYIEKYKNARQNITDARNANIVKCSTLQYFEDYI